MAMKVVHIELSLPTLSWSLTVSLRQESSTTASGSAPGGTDVDTIYALKFISVDIYCMSSYYTVSYMGSYGSFISSA